MTKQDFNISDSVIFDSTPSFIVDIFVSPSSGNIIYEVETKEAIPFKVYAEAQELKKDEN